MRDWLERLVPLATVAGGIIAVIMLFLYLQDRQSSPIDDQPFGVITLTESLAPQIFESMELTPTANLAMATNTSAPTLFPRRNVGELPVKDDFDDGFLDGWESNGDGSITPVDGMLEIRATSPTIAYTGEEYWHNYSVAISFMPVAIDNNTKYGIVVRRSDNCQLYYISLTTFNNNSGKVLAELLKYLDCDQGKVSALDQKVVNFYPNFWHTVEVQITGDSSANIRVWIDNQLTLSFNDSDGFIYSGGIGLRVEHATIRFDNLSVEANK